MERKGERGRERERERERAVDSRHMCTLQVQSLGDGETIHCVQPMDRGGEKGHKDSWGRHSGCRAGDD